MKKTLMSVVFVSMTIFVVSCTSTPVIPDGNNRSPINSQEKIEGYKYRIDNDTKNYAECTSLSRKYESVLQQLASLKADMLLLQLSRVSTLQTPEKSRISPAQSFNDKYNNGETIEVRQNSVVFRLSQPFNKANMKPSKPLEEQLLKAARNAKRIDIRGRTDAQTDNAIDKYIASKRATNASRYLVSHGIQSSKIKCSYLAAGDNIAENKSVEGRAKNRRVDIEVYQD